MANPVVTGIYHAENVSNFTEIDNTLLEDPRLSWKAKGILACCLSLRKELIQIHDITERTSSGRKSIRSGFKELERFGYARLVRGGSKGGGAWQVFATPELLKAQIQSENSTSKTATINR